MNSFVDLIHSKARSRRDLYFGGTFGLDILEKGYKKLDGVGEIWFYTGWRFSERFCGRF